LFLLFAGVYISCKSKTTTSSEPATIVEKVLPVPKAREIIHNALMHSSNYFWEVYFKLGDASNTSISQGKRLAELAKLDSMIAPGIERNNTTLNVLKGVANPDSSIVYKEYALKLVQWIKQFYEKKYPAFAQSIRSGDDNKITTAYMDVQKFIELVNADYNSFEQASNSIRDKYNIPKTYHFIKNEQDIPVDIDEKILSDTSSH
jgi:hypothetical protein